MEPGGHVFFCNSHNGGPVKKNFLRLALFCSLFLVNFGWAQTFDLNSKPQDQNQKSQPKQNNGKRQSAGSGQHRWRRLDCLWHQWQRMGRQY